MTTLWNRSNKFIIISAECTSKIGVQLHSNNHRTVFSFHSSLWSVSTPIVRISVGVVVLGCRGGSGKRSRSRSRKSVRLRGWHCSNVGCYQENSKDNLQRKIKTQIKHYRILQKKELLTRALNILDDVSLGKRCKEQLCPLFKQHPLLYRCILIGSLNAG